MRVEQPLPLRCVAEPCGVIDAIRSDGKGRSVMRAPGDVPVLMAEPHRRHLAIQPDQRMVADIGVVDMAPYDDRVSVGVHCHRYAAAFAGMVGRLDVWAETPALIIGDGII